MGYELSRTVDTDFESTLERVTAELAAEGFGILTEIDVKAKLAEKLGVEQRPYRILGACNPQFAHQAIELEGRIGVLMPCSVLVRELESGEVEVAAMDPATALATTGNTALAPLAAEARQRLERVLAAL